MFLSSLGFELLLHVFGDRAESLHLEHESFLVNLVGLGPPEARRKRSDLLDSCQTLSLQVNRFLPDCCKATKVYFDVRLVPRSIGCNADDVCFKPFAFEVKYVETLKHLKFVRPAPLLENLKFLP